MVSADSPHDGLAPNDCLAEEATSRRIVEAAIEIMTRDGELKPNMRELMAMAGVSTRAFYRHFPTKDALISTIIDGIYSEMFETLDARTAAEALAEDKLTGWIDGVLSYAVNPVTSARGRALVLHQGQLSREFADVYLKAGRVLIRQVGAIIEAGVDAGRFHSADIKGDARIISTLTLAAMQRHVLLSTEPQPSEVRGMTEFALRALGMRRE